MCLIVWGRSEDCEGWWCDLVVRAWVAPARELGPWAQFLVMTDFSLCTILLIGHAFTVLKAR